MAENQICSLANRDCVPCKGGVPPLKGEALRQYQTELGGNWELIDEQRLEKTYTFKNFREALNFTVRVGELAESVGHHPDIFLTWGKVKITIWTHKISGLTESDFILAAKVDSLDLT
jgi:4a-hydroxytetrahydrobiopterin dehydratase